MIFDDAGNLMNPWIKIRLKARESFIGQKKDVRSPLELGEFAGETVAMTN